MLYNKLRRKEREWEMNKERRWDSEVEKATFAREKGGKSGRNYNNRLREKRKVERMEMREWKCLIQSQRNSVLPQRQIQGLSIKMPRCIRKWRQLQIWHCNSTGMKQLSLEELVALCGLLGSVLPALVGVGLRWRGGQLGHRALVRDGVGLADRRVGLCSRWVWLRGSGVWLGLRAVLLGQRALLLWAGGWWRITDLWGSKRRTECEIMMFTFKFYLQVNVFCEAWINFLPLGGSVKPVNTTLT